MPAKKQDDFDEQLKGILEKDPRFAPEAYRFVFEALQYTTRMIGQRRHVTGQELLEGIRRLALEQFTMLAKLVFEFWGVHRTEDFGDIVFNMVEDGLMGRQETDTKQDFADGYNFEDAFVKEAMKQPAKIVSPPHRQRRSKS